MRWSPSVTVAAVIRRNDRFLMVEESPDGCAVINQPAGHLEPGESLTDAVRREVLEETACRFEPTGLVGIYRWGVPGSTRSYLRLCFTGQVGEPVDGHARDPDIIATHWLTRAEIAAGTLIPRSPMVLRCIDDAVGADPLPLSSLHEVE
jgi:ADP-ribose pyrophosphatase YjhB (NUDIX family)